MNQINWIKVNSYHSYRHGSRKSRSIYPSEYDIENQRAVDVWQGHYIPRYAHGNARKQYNLS